MFILEKLNRLKQYSKIIITVDKELVDASESLKLKINDVLLYYFNTSLYHLIEKPSGRDKKILSFQKGLFCQDLKMEKYFFKIVYSELVDGEENSEMAIILLNIKNKINEHFSNN